MYPTGAFCTHGSLYLIRNFEVLVWRRLMWLPAGDARRMQLDRGGNQNRDLDPKIRPLRLTTPEKKSLIAFLRSLKGTSLITNDSTTKQQIGTKMAPIREPRSQPAETGVLAIVSKHAVDAKFFLYPIQTQISQLDVAFDPRLPLHIFNTLGVSHHSQHYCVKLPDRR